MSGSGKNVVESMNSSSIAKYNASNEEHMFVKCHHDLSIVHQICKRSPNRDKKSYGCPLWKDEEDEMSLFEKNRILAQRVNELVAEFEKRDNLKEENEMLKTKISKGKLKRTKSENEVKELTDEVLGLKLKATRNSVVEKFVPFFILVLVVLFVTRVI